jgi:hypothetical protein
VDALEVESISDRLQLGDEQLDRPPVGRHLDPRLAAADLVIEDDSAAGFG